MKPLEAETTATKEKEKSAPAVGGSIDWGDWDVTSLRVNPETWKAVKHVAIDLDVSVSEAQDLLLQYATKDRQGFDAFVQKQQQDSSARSKASGKTTK